MNGLKKGNKIVFFVLFYFFLLATNVNAEDCSALIQKLYDSADGYFIEYDLTVNTSNVSVVAYASGTLGAEVFFGEKILVARKEPLLYSSKQYFRQELCQKSNNPDNQILCADSPRFSRSQPFDITSKGEITLALYSNNAKVSLKYLHYNQTIDISSVRCEYGILSGVATSQNGFRSLLTIALRRGGEKPK